MFSNEKNLDGIGFVFLVFALFTMLFFINPKDFEGRADDLYEIKFDNITFKAKEVYYEGNKIYFFDELSKDSIMINDSYFVKKPRNRK